MTMAYFIMTKRVRQDVFTSFSQHLLNTCCRLSLYDVLLTVPYYAGRCFSSGAAVNVFDSKHILQTLGYQIVISLVRY